MTRKLQTWMVSELLHPADLAGSCAVVIDILRASSTMTTALQNGARAVVPCLSVEEAEAARASLAGCQTVLGGERHGLLIAGFDVGNTPADYTQERMADATVVFTTTNGTKALHRCGEAAEVLVGCFLNLSAVAKHLQWRSEDVHLVCAGTNSQVTLEDCLFAGVLAEMLIRQGEWELNDSTRICQGLAAQWNPEKGNLAAGLLHSQGGRNLTGLKLQDDVAYCAQTDLSSLIPVWNAKTNRIQGLFAE